MVRNCIAAIVAWIVLTAAYAAWLWKRITPQSNALIVALLMGTIVWVGLAMMHGARYTLRDWNARNRLARGERPNDGDLVAAIGEIRPVFESLRAPFSDRDCVLYAYEIGGRPGEGPKDYVGFAMARCAVHTPYGSFTLGTFPVVDRIPRDVGDRARAEQYIASTMFEPLENVVGVVKSTFSLFSLVPPVRKDWRIGEPSQIGQAFERVIESGARVTAIGRYQSATSTIVSDTKEKGYLRLWPGGEPLRQSSFPGAAVMQVIGGAAIIVIANAVFWFVLNLKR